MNKGELKKISNLVIEFLKPILSAAEDLDSAKVLMLELGYVSPEQDNLFSQIGGVLATIEDVVGTIEEMDDNTDNSELIARIVKDLVASLASIFDNLKEISSIFQSELAGSPLLTDTDLLAELPSRLVNLLVVRFLEDNYYTTYSILKIFGIIEVVEVNELGNPLLFSHIEYSFHWEKIGDLFTKPKDLILSTLKSQNQYLYDKTLYALHEIGSSVGLIPHYRDPGIDTLKFINNNSNIENWSGFSDLEILRFPFIPGKVDAVGMDVYPIIDTNSDQITGLVFGIGSNVQLEFDISDDFKIKLEFSGNISNGFGFSIDNNNDFKFIADLFSSPQVLLNNAQLGFKTSLIGKSKIIENEGDKLFRIGEPEGSRLEIGTFGLALGVEKNEDVNLSINTDLIDGLIAINFGNADGFVSNIAGNGIEGNFNLGIGFSNKDGIYFKGSAGLEIRLPTHIELGPIEIQNLTIGLMPKDGKIPINVGATIKANLGPLQAVVENMGLSATLSFPSDGGNLGPIDLAMGFKPPNGVGLSLDTGVVKGGGYLFFDYDREEYAGALELVISEWIAVKAIGLITTKLPDGSKGFSMIIIISVEFGAGLQLGMGFTLLGVGGIVGINRIVKVDALREGVVTGGAESIMFPKDVVANAPRILSDLRAFFPAHNDQHLVGPMAKIGYGSPTLASLSLGVIIEFPDVNITILGVLKVLLPTEDAAVLKLQINLLGRIEPSKEQMWFVAFLYDSRILFITIEGGIGFWLKWGNNSNFVLTIGGFHPQYTPPPNLPFPVPQRLAVNILNESSAKIRIEGYFAVTSNTVQFGARVELFFGVSAFNIDGHFGFDALFQFNPFYFSFSLSVSLSVKLFGFGLFSVGFSGLLEGPTPWHIKGKGKIGFLFFSVSVPFEHTWGEERHTILPPIEVFPLVEREFAAITNWQAIVPNNSSILVSLRQLGSSSTDELILHPVGTLRVSQTKLPLKLKLDKIGNQRPLDADKFSISASISGNNLNVSDVTDRFATGEFKNLSNSQKLSSPGFELYESGVEIKPDGEQLKTSMAVKRIIRYETVIIDNNFKRHLVKFYKVLHTAFTAVYATLFTHFLNGGAVTKSTLSQHHKKQIQPNKAVIKVEPNRYTVAFNDTNKPVDTAATQFISQASAMDYIQEQISLDPAAASQMHVIPNTEVNANAA